MNKIFRFRYDKSITISGMCILKESSSVCPRIDFMRMGRQLNVLSTAFIIAKIKETSLVLSLKDKAAINCIYSDGKY